MTNNSVETIQTRANNHQVPSIVSLLNPAVRGLLRLGVPMGPMTLLTVLGRKTGKQRTTPVAILKQEGGRYLASVYGESNWVRNLRAAREGILRHGRHSETITAVELTPQEAAPVLKTGLAAAPGFLQRYFEATPASPLEDFEQEALHHPVFKVDEAVVASTSA